MSLRAPYSPGFLTRNCEADKKRPFVTSEPLEGSPDCSWTRFREPLLRAYPHPQDEFVWEEKLGSGVDGIVWKVRVGETFFAIKVFWDNVAPSGISYWAVQRECLNAALLQMIEHAVDSDGPIYLKPDPTSRVGEMPSITSMRSRTKAGHDENSNT